MDGKNKDNIKYSPYLDFDKVNTYLNSNEDENKNITIKEKENINNKEEEDIQNVSENENTIKE